MSLPNVKEVIKDGGLGLIAPAASGVFGIAGPAAAGNNEQLYILNDPATAEDTFTAGSLLEAIQDAFANGATKILAVKADPAGGSAATSGSITHTGTGNATTATGGTPQSDREFKLEVTVGATSDVAGGKYKLSQNGGLTWGAETKFPASGTAIDLGNGAAITFTNAGSTPELVAGDTYSWSTTEAKPTTQKTLDAVEILGDNDELSWIHVVGATDSTFRASISAYNAGLKAQHKYIFFVLEADRPAAGETTDQWITALNADSASFFDSDVMVNAGWGLLTDRHGEAVIRNGAGIIDGLIAKAAVHQSIGWVGGLRVNNMLRLFPTDLNEAQIETLDETGRYATFRFWPGQGFRATNGRAMASATSDYRYLESTRTMYKAVKLVRTAALPFVNSVADAAGLIALQKTCETPLDAMRSAGEIEGFEVLIPAGQDIVSIGAVKVQVSVIVKGIMRTITLTFGLAREVKK